jgi:hypothetical protein
VTVGDYRPAGHYNVVTHDELVGRTTLSLDTVKLSNPKDAIGTLKAALSYVPCTVLMELGLGMMEGGMKYGRHNYRAIGVRGSVYYDATIRHLFSWWEGEDIDPDSGLSHITKAIASLVVLRDAMIQSKWHDDRPPSTMDGWIGPLNDKVKALAAKYPEPVAPYTQENTRGV